MTHPVRRISAAPSLAAVAALLASCTVGPDYRRPAVATPAAFMSAAAIAARPAADAPDDAAWWRSFGDPVLVGLVDRGLARNLEVDQALARVAQARAGLRGADAALLPSGTVDASASAQRFSQRTLQGRQFDAFGVDPDFEDYEAGASVGWDVDLFGGRRRDREAALAEYQASAAGEAAARLAVAAEVADAYVTVRGLQSRIAIASGQASTQARLADTIGLQFRRGVASELQWRQAVGAQRQVAAQVPALTLALDAAMNALDVLLGDQPGTVRPLLAAAAPVPSAPGVADVGTPADLLRRRPDIVVAERRLAASNARIGSAISEYFPRISLGALLGTAASAPAALFGGAATQASAGVGLRWRLFDFGRVDSEIRLARGGNAEALATYRLSVLRATEDVEDAFSALLNREAQAREMVEAERNLARARTAANAAFAGGVVSLVEVLDADTRLLAARDGLVAARVEAARSAIASYRALGGGWEAAYRPAAGADVPGPSGTTGGR